MTEHLPAEAELELKRRLGQRSASALEKHLGLTTVGELLNYFPRRYLKRGELTSIAELPRDENVTLVARVVSCTTRRMRARKGTLTDVVVSDDSVRGLNQVHLTFFNAYRADKELLPGTLAMFAGKVTTYQRQLTLTNPDYVLLEDESGFDAEEARRPVPLYPATAKLSSWRIKAAVEALLAIVDFSRIEDPVPADIAIRDRLYSLEDAYQQIHRPQDMESVAKAHERFRYQEALILQTALARRRAQAAAEDTSKSPTSSVQMQHIRNATTKINYAGKTFLVDPLLAKKGAYPGFEGTFRSHLRNPLVELPMPAEDVMKGVDALIVSHTHLDHWDGGEHQLVPKLDFAQFRWDGVSARECSSGEACRVEQALSERSGDFYHVPALA